MNNEKKLGFGLMRLPLLDKNDAASIDLEETKKMVDAFIEKGFTYFDTAWMYCGFASEKAAKAALVDRYPRDKYTLATKLHSGFFDSFEDRDKIFNAQLENTGAGYFDYYLIHGIDAGSYPKYEQFDCFNWLRDKKKQGLVKHMGISFHDTPELLDEILTKHSRACYEIAKKHGIPVIVMEPVKGGTLAKLPDEAEKLLKDYNPEASIASWAVRFAASLDNVMMVLSGMSSMEQLQDNVSYMEDFKPMNEEERALCFKVADIINSQIAIPCTGCSYCTEGCPMKIAIPQYFSMYNEDMREAEDKGWTANLSNYQLVSQKFGKASDCVACGQCENACPQHLSIIEHLKSVAKRFE